MYAVMQRSCGASQCCCAKVKASGGIRTPEFTAELVEAGADRIGAGDGVKLVK